MAEPFTKSGITPSELEEDELYGVLMQARGEEKALEAPFLHRRIRMAEDSIEHELGIHLGERRVASNPVARGLDPSTYDIAEPGYDLGPESFLGDSWGQLQLNFRPVKQVTAFKYCFPGVAAASAASLPLEWLDIDYKFGQIEVVARGGPESIIHLQVQRPVWGLIAGARRLPKSIYVDYVSGLSPAALGKDHADLLAAIRIRATLLAFGVLTTTRTGGLGSQSLSIDGLSRNESYNGGKWGPYSGAIERFMEDEKLLLAGWKAANREPITVW